MTNLQTKKAIEEAIRHFSEVNEVKSQLIINRLDTISSLLTKQNGSIADTIRRVNVIEGDHARRELICPHRNTIAELLKYKQENTTIKKYLRNWVIVATTVVNVLMGLVAWFFNRT